MAKQAKRSPSPHEIAREANKARTREALLVAAERLFAERGLDTSLDEICAEAGYTRGAFYVHFADRDELLSAVMHRVGDATLDALLGPADGAELDLATIAGRFLDGLADGRYPLSRRGAMRPYQLLDACARSTAVRDRYVELVERSTARVGRALRASQERGALRADVDVDALASLVLALAIGAHTLFDLEARTDLARGALTLFALLAPAAASPKADAAPTKKPRRKARLPSGDG